MIVFKRVVLILFLVLLRVSLVYSHVSFKFRNNNFKNGNQIKEYVLKHAPLLNIKECDFLKKSNKKKQNITSLVDTIKIDNSQEKGYFQFGIKSGLNLSSSQLYKTVYSQSSLPSKSKQSILGGVSFAYNLKKIFSFGIDISYNSLGFMHKTAATDINGSLTYYYYQEWIFKYLYTPLTIGIRTNRNLYIGSKLAGGPSFLLKQQFKGDNFTSKIDDSNASNVPFTYSVELGLGYRFKNSFSIEVAGSYLRLNDKLACNSKNISIGINKFL